MRYLAIIALVAAVFGMANIAAASAQETGQSGDDNVFTIVADYDPDDDYDVIQEHRELQGTLTATVDGAECTTVDIRTPGAVSLRLGEEGQPEQCGRAGAEVVLYNSYGNEMFRRFSVEPGATVTMTNYAVAPADTNGPSPAAAGSGGLAASAGGSHSESVAAGLAAVLLVLLAVWLTGLRLRRATLTSPDRP